MFRLLLASLCLITGTSLFATHNIAGEITYRSISDTSPTYEIAIKTWTYGSSPAASDSLELIIYECDSLIPIYRDWIIRDSTDTLHTGLGIEIRWYILEAYTFPERRCYRLCMTDPNRGQNIINIQNSVNVPMAFEATVHTNNVPSVEFNSSPVIPASAIATAQPFHTFVQNTLLFDPDGDNLFVHFVEPLAGCGIPVFGYTFPDDVKHTTSGFPNDISIDATGFIEWDMPTIEAVYQIGIVVEEYRGPKRLGAIYRDMQIIVTNDSIALGTPVPRDLQMQVWPNPASTTIMISGDRTMPPISIFDITGRPHFWTERSSKSHEIDIANWPDGVYFVQWEDDKGGVGNKKFIKISE